MSTGGGRWNQNIFEGRNGGEGREKGGRERNHLKEKRRREEGGGNGQEGEGSTVAQSIRQ